jgi:CRISPR-associated protein Cas6
MYWQETKVEEPVTVPDGVVDVAFAIRCRRLPVDHAWVLAEAVRAVLPWLDQETAAGIHPIHVADSGNGWTRPAAPDDVLYPSRRTRLVLRLPRTRLSDVAALAGRTLDLAGYPLEVEKQSEVKRLSELTTIFSRYVVVEAGADEEQAFLAQAHTHLTAMGLRPKKMLCGMEHIIATPEGAIRARSLMLADLTVEESVRLQQEGLGPKRLLGCGLFIPHKGIREVATPQD